MLPRAAWPRVSGNGHVTVPDGWTETSFERGTYGPDDREGFVAVLEGEEATIAVVPARYRRQYGEQRIRALTADWTEHRSDPAVPLGDVAPTTAFVTRATTRLRGRERHDTVCITADPDDALAVAVWLTRVGDADALRRRVDRHAGTGGPTSGRAIISDDDVLGAFFAAEPRHCVFTGRETRSHRIEVPYRYVEVLTADRLRDGDAVRFPTTVEGLTGMVSHTAWEEQGLVNVDFGAALRRGAAGQYRLDPDVVSVVRDADVTEFALADLGESTGDASGN